MSQPKAQREVKRADIGSKQGHKKTLELIALKIRVSRKQMLLTLEKEGELRIFSECPLCKQFFQPARAEDPRLSTCTVSCLEEASIASQAIEYPVLGITLAALTLPTASRIIVICLSTVRK